MVCESMNTESKWRSEHCVRLIHGVLLLVSSGVFILARGLPVSGVEGGDGRTVWGNAGFAPRWVATTATLFLLCWGVWMCGSAAMSLVRQSKRSAGG